MFLSKIEKNESTVLAVKDIKVNRITGFFLPLIYVFLFFINLACLLVFIISGLVTALLVGVVQPGSLMSPNRFVNSNFSGIVSIAAVYSFFQIVQVFFLPKYKLTFDKRGDKVVFRRFAGTWLPFPVKKRFPRESIKSFRVRRSGYGYGSYVFKSGSKPVKLFTEASRGHVWRVTRELGEILEKDVKQYYWRNK